MRDMINKFPRNAEGFIDDIIEDKSTGVIPIDSFNVNNLYDIRNNQTIVDLENGRELVKLHGTVYEKIVEDNKLKLREV